MAPDVIVDGPAPRLVFAVTSKAIRDPRGFQGPTPRCAWGDSGMLP
jgi:hypothetical protein